MSRRTAIDSERLEAAKQHVRRQLAILALHPEEAEIPSNQRAPLGRHFPLAPFDTDMIERLGTLQVWSPEALFQRFTHIDESSIEPFYGDNAEGDGPYAPVEMLTENSHARMKLIAESDRFQLSAISLIADYAVQDVSFYRLIAALNARLAEDNWQGPNEVRKIIANVLRNPEPKGKGGAKRATHFMRDLLLLSLIQSLVDSFEGLAKTGAQNTERGDEACSIVTSVWDDEFREYTETIDGKVKKFHPARPLPATAARNVWVKRAK